MWKTLSYIWNKERSHRNKRDSEVESCQRNMIIIKQTDVMEIKNKKKVVVSWAVIELCNNWKKLRRVSMCHAFSMELLLNMSIFSHKVNKPNHKIFVNTQRKTGAPITKTYSQHHTTATDLSSSTPEATNQPSGSKSIFFFILQAIITQLLQHMP